MKNQWPRIDRALAALADPHRRAVVERLRVRPHRAGELAEALKLSPPALSRHLRLLRQSGVVSVSLGEADARVREYRLRPEGLRELAQWLVGLDAHWGTQLEAFAAHVAKAGEGDER